MFFLYQKSRSYLGQWHLTGSLDSREEGILPNRVHMSMLLGEIMAALECKGGEREGPSMVDGRDRNRPAMGEREVGDEAYSSLAKQIHLLVDSAPLKGNGKIQTPQY